MAVEQVTGPVAYHGEGPVWYPGWGGLRFVDMLAGDVLSLGADGRVERRHVGSIAAALRPRRGGGAVIGVARGFALEDPDGTVTALPALWSDAGIRMNEGGCDPDGRFYCGSMAYDQSAGAASAVPARPGRFRGRGAGARHGVQRVGMEPGRITGLLQRHRHRGHLGVRLRHRRRADQPAHVRRAARRRAPGRADRGRRRRRVDGGVQRWRRLPVQRRRRAGGEAGGAGAQGDRVHLRRRATSTSCSSPPRRRTSTPARTRSQGLCSAPRWGSKASRSGLSPAEATTVRLRGSAIRRETGRRPRPRGQRVSPRSFGSGLGVSAAEASPARRWAISATMSRKAFSVSG